MNKKVSAVFLLLSVIFCVCLILANILEAKIVNISGVTVTAGLMLFPITYIINDCIVEVWGYKKSRLIIWLGFAVNFAVVALFQIAIALPPDPAWHNQQAFEAIFSITPRIAAGSLVAFLAGSFINAYIMSKMKIASKGKHFSLRAVVSTMAGEGVDSVIFFPIAFWGVLPEKTILDLIIAQAIIKTVYEIIILPITIKVVVYLKKREESDAYDNGISYNILKIKEL